MASERLPIHRKLRAQVVARLSEFRDYAPLPNCVPIIDVFDDSASSGFDVVVVSQWCGGCSLARLLNAGVAPGLELTLYILKVLSASLSESYRRVKARGHVSPVGVVSPGRVWIDRHATVRMRNPFVWSCISGAQEKLQAAGRDVAALQDILRQLTGAWSTGRDDDGKQTKVPAAIESLLAATREPTESATDFLERFSRAVEEVADSHGAVQAAAVAELDSFAPLFEREAALVAHETDAPTIADTEDRAQITRSGAVESRETDQDGPASLTSETDLEHQARGILAVSPGAETTRETDEDFLAQFQSETDLQQQASVVPAAPPGPDPSPGMDLPREKARLWPRLVAAAAVMPVLVGVGMLLFVQRPGFPPGGATDSGEPPGTLDLRALQVSPPDASLYLVLADADRPYDGRAISLESGMHEIEIRAEGHKATRVAVQVTPGETATVVRESYRLRRRASSLRGLAHGKTEEVFP